MSSAASELERLARLRLEGSISDEEFAELKAQVIKSGLEMRSAPDPPEKHVRGDSREKPGSLASGAAGIAGLLMVASVLMPWWSVLGVPRTGMQADVGPILLVGGLVIALLGFAGLLTPRRFGGLVAAAAATSLALGFLAAAGLATGIAEQNQSLGIEGFTTVGSGPGIYVLAAIGALVAGLLIQRPRRVQTAARPFNIGRDLAQIPQLVRHRAVWIPVLVTTISGVLLIAAGHNQLVNLVAQLFVVPPPIAGPLLAGLLAPRASYLAGGMVGLWAAIVFAGVVFAIPANPSVQVTTADRVSVALYAVAISPLLGLVIGGIAGYLRRFLGSPPAGTDASAGDGLDRAVN